MEEKKLKLQLEFTESEVKGVCFLMDKELSSEDWDGITEKPVKFDINKLPADEGDKKGFSIMFIAIALSLYKESKGNK
ncbi:MAG: hypothetical protein Q4D56_06275 [Bacteroides sp.]|nr:hypothetical protein [Bacteroides sp.]